MQKIKRAKRMKLSRRNLQNELSTHGTLNFTKYVGITFHFLTGKFFWNKSDTNLKVIILY